MVSQSDPIYVFKCMFKVHEIQLSESQLSESIFFSEILLFIEYMISDIEDCMVHSFVLKRPLPCPILPFTGIRHKKLCTPRLKSVSSCSRLRYDSIMKPWPWSPALMSIPYWSEGLSCHQHSKAVCYCFLSPFPSSFLFDFNMTIYIGYLIS